MPTLPQTSYSQSYVDGLRERHERELGEAVASARQEASTRAEELEGRALAAECRVRELEPLGRAYEAAIEDRARLDGELRRAREEADASKLALELAEAEIALETKGRRAAEDQARAALAAQAAAEARAQAAEAERDRLTEEYTSPSRTRRSTDKKPVVS